MKIDNEIDPDNEQIRKMRKELTELLNRAQFKKDPTEGGHLSVTRKTETTTWSIKARPSSGGLTYLNDETPKLNEDSLKKLLGQLSTDEYRVETDSVEVAAGTQDSEVEVIMTEDGDVLCETEVTEREVTKNFEHTFKVEDDDHRPVEPPRRWYGAVTDRLPGKNDVADSLLLFVCMPDDAEDAAGNLIEEFNTVHARRSRILSNIWFGWTLFWLVFSKAKTRLLRSALGPAMDKWIGPS